MGIATSSEAQTAPLASVEQTVVANTSRSAEASIEISAANLSIDINSPTTTMNDQDDDRPVALRQGQRIERNATADQPSDASSTIDRIGESENQALRLITDADDVVDDRDQPERTGDHQSLAEFKEELRVKREQRISAIADLKNEVVKLRQDLAAEREISKQLRADRSHATPPPLNQEDGSRITSDGVDTTDHQWRVAAVAAVPNINDDKCDATESADDNDVVTTTTNTSLRAQLSDANHELQLANAECLRVSTELTITQRQVASLKEVIVVTKEMVAIRESQLEQLRSKLKIIEDSLAERELSLMSDTLRREYDRQLANIRSLRTLYEERSRVNAAEKENLIRQLDTKRTEMEAEVEKSANLESRVATLEKELEEATSKLSHIKDDLLDSNSANKSLEADSAVINQLFSQLLSGFSGGNDLNIDKLATMLEQNRDLLSDITNRESSHNGSAALPRLLFDLVSEVEAKDEEQESAPQLDAIEQANENIAGNKVSPQEIVDNLPKVWKVLIELLNHQKTEPVPFTENGDSEHCYKLVQSPTGPQQVLSVSKTYIRLKDLIVEKKSLQKETHKLKNLNCHLETRLDQQEKRLATVTVELNKTWTLVGRMQRQHRQLHTHEQVLRYQLSQKRRMLNELKEELEYCRRKWNLAREKNDESQVQWDTLRREFSARKLQDSGSQNSAESGFSDDPVSDDEGLEVPTLCEVKPELFEVPVIIAQPVLLHNAPNLEEKAEASGSGDKPKLSAELRQKKAKKVKTKSSAETLEDMFYRISGMDPPEVPSSEESEEEDELYEEQIQELGTLLAIPEEIVTFTEQETTQSSTPEPEQQILSDFADPEDEERRQRRAERFERLEEQCAQLINQVMKTATRGNELNKQLDDVHNRYRTPTREATATSSATSTFDEGASTSTAVPVVDTDATGLTEKEQEFMSRRAARLKRLEDECKAFLSKVNATNDRATDLNTKLDTLHEHHSARLAERKAASNGSSIDERVDVDTVSSVLNDDQTRQILNDPAIDEISIAIEETELSADAETPRDELLNTAENAPSTSPSTLVIETNNVQDHPLANPGNATTADNSQSSDE